MQNGERCPHLSPRRGRRGDKAQTRSRSAPHRGEGGRHARRQSPREGGQEREASAHLAYGLGLGGRPGGDHGAPRHLCVRRHEGLRGLGARGCRGGWGEGHGCPGIHLRSCCRRRGCRGSDGHCTRRQAGTGRSPSCLRAWRRLGGRRCTWGWSHSDCHHRRHGWSGQRGTHRGPRRRLPHPGALLGVLPDARVGVHPGGLGVGSPGGRRGGEGPAEGRSCQRPN
mmetsp:Transcript_48931/g.104056  ORF Transcript_48931/g.104056 Transcript_48931/m.104056 type:complete len:225 (+) Transcript_48931:164-838(+)